jgi:acetate kinase
MFMMQQENLSASEMENILNKKIGLMGITGRFTTRRDVIENAQKGDKRCQIAIDIEAYRIKKYIGAYMAAIGKVDAVVFTAGVGEIASKSAKKCWKG